MTATPITRAGGTVAFGSGSLGQPAPLFYERFAPAGRRSRGTVVMVHGGAHAGSCFLQTAAGEPGWIFDFVEAGFAVLTPDWPGTGRSGYVPLDRLSGELIVAGLRALCDTVEGPLIVLTHSMSGAYGWRLLELMGARIAALVGVAPAPPGNIQAETPLLAETEDAVELMSFGQRVTIETRAPYMPPRAFVDRKLVGASTRFPRDRLDVYAASLLPIPPRLLIERQNVGGRQLKVADPRRLAGGRVLILTGTEDLDHPRMLDESIADWLSDQGCRADFAWLGDLGIAGNGHMLMLEDNASQIASIILDWLAAEVPAV